MSTPSAILALLATAMVAFMVSGAFSGELAAPSAAVSGDRGIVLAGGMSGGGGGMGGGAGGMGGGNIGGGMGAGNFGGGMGGGNFGGGMFHGPLTDFDVQQPSHANAASDSYTYQCITPAGHCSFVAPAWLRASSLHSGAGCACDSGQTQGRVQ
jgi:hypothetical protein